MFKNFFLFEMKYRLQRPMVYIFFLINFLLVFSATVSPNVMIGNSNDAVHLNSPHAIMSLTLMMTLIGIFMTTAFINTSILRDFDYKFDGILFATPISKWGYLGGRFLGAYLMALIPFIGVFAGLALGAASSMVDASDISPFSIWPYVAAFFIGVVPNTLLVAAVVFLLAAIYRSSLISFLGAIVILIVYVMMLSFIGDLDNEFIAMLIDPLGISTHGLVTKYWTIEEKNTLLLPLTGGVLWNRIIWIVVSVCCLLLTYFRFSFSVKAKKLKKNNNTNTSAAPSVIPMFSNLKALPVVHVQDNFKTTWQQFVHQSKMELKGIAKGLPFKILLVMGVLNMIAAMTRVDEMRGTGNYPVTYLMVDSIRGSLYLFLNAIIMYYSGLLVWRERDAKMDEFFDAAPFSTWIPFASKLFGLMGMTVIILLVAIACGVSFQFMSGHTHFELGVYFREFLIYDMSWLTVLMVVSMLIQTLVSNKYIGYFAFLLVVIACMFGPRFFETQSNLLFLGTPQYIYSDMNAWSLYAKGLAWFHTYWALFAGMLGLASILFWVRGKSLTFSQRMNIARQRFTGTTAKLAFVLLLLWIGTGSFLFYQTKVVNQIVSQNAIEKVAVDYENKYKQFQHIAQPRITAVDYDIAIYPHDRNFSVKANIEAKNKTEESIREIHFTLANDFDLTIDIPGAILIKEDDDLDYRIYELDKPLMPGELLNFEVRVDYVSKGIENEVSNTDIVKSGTFLSNYKLIPTIGYSAQNELSDRKKRAEYNLPVRPRMEQLHANCGNACQNSYISSDADWVNVSSTISTSIDQSAIAPGSLVKQWEENNRNYFRYELKKPVLNFYSFISGVFEIEREEWTAPDGKKVDLEVYYHKGHEFNVSKMLASLRHSLDYYTKHFTPYPHEQARIIEFPRYASFAQAFPGTMPYSESIGFIANLKEKDAIDMVYYVVAHEMAHQWWAHQVIGAEVQGATMLSETFSQYSALMVMQEKYGKDKMKQFMKYEMDGYLRGRGREEVKELPLMFNESQQYIHYQKGSVVMYALQDYIGEDSLNMALRKFAEAVSYQEAPYTNTLEVMDYISAVTPDSLQYLLDDMFRNITLYSNKTNTATYKKLENGSFEVRIDVSVEKYRADSLGKETLIPHNDFIDIGVFSKEKNEGEKYGRPILVERHRIGARDTSFIVVVNELPFEAGIDPNYLLVDRFPEDNLMKVTEDF